jgi:alpha-L-arabinofuranosidase
MKTRSFILSSLLLSAVALNAQVTLDIDAVKKSVAISPTLNGIFFEDINHAGDGGLYAELIRNRSFEDNSSEPETWKVFKQFGSSAEMQLVTQNLLNDKQKHALMVKIKATPKFQAGVSNEGFWGINAVQGRTYKLTFWAKGKNYKGSLTAVLMDATGSVEYAKTKVEGNLTGVWKKYTATLTSKGTDGKACFAILGNAKGTIYLDMVSLFPPTFKNRENGCRPELAQLLYNMKPKFMRFPGGCFVEGQESSDNAFRWERTVGPIEKRPGHNNRNWGYRTSDGMGFHEFLQLSEDIGAKPLYVVNIGLWHGGLTPLDSIQPWIDECMQALEYANGDTNTKYGKMRAENGHPEPFNIEYLEIGNENNQPDAKAQSDHYYDRYIKFSKAVLAKYPKMHLIGNVAAWGTDNPKWESNAPVELIDEHYYRNPAWFADNFNKYDSYDRNSHKIYCGEYAVTSGFGKTGNLNAALGEAVYMMGMENNSDVVMMNSYAPIFVNENNIAWQPDMIRYNSSKVMCTPSYYTQKLMAENIGDYVLSVNQSNPYKDEPVVETPQKSINVGVGTWATKVSFDDVSVRFENTSCKDECNSDSTWKTTHSGWIVSDGNLSQTSMDEGNIDLFKKEITSTKYSYNVRARKNSGSEGFLVIFNYIDENNYCWFNVGGWGNTQHSVEQTVDGGRTPIAYAKGGVENGRWYDARVDVDGDSIRCFLDNKLIIATKLKKALAGIYSNATINEKNGEVFVKVVNTGHTATTAIINLKNMNVGSAEVTRLSSANGTDENTMENPTRIYPINETLSPNGHSVAVDIPAFSLNIVKIKK